MRLLIGIDVGWSLKRRSCALATLGHVTQSHARQFSGGVSVGLYRLNQLLEELRRLVCTFPEECATAVLVIDGPVGPEMEAILTRAVDGAFAKGGFSRRAPGYGITEGSGLKLAQVAAQILRLLKDLSLRVHPWLGGELPSDRFVVAETNPTPAMAVLVPQQDVATLPSRAHPKELDGRRIRAKSDWYWHLGGGQYAARTLGEPSIHAEVNHERVAALFALALAATLSGHSTKAGRPVAVGDQDGIYLLPAEIDDTWEADVVRIGIAHGRPDLRNGSAAPPPSKPIPRDAPQTATTRRHEHATSGGRGSVRVVLNDNGGLNVAANPWLASIDVPCQLCAREGRLVFTVVAPFAGRSDMYRISPSALTLANRLKFAGGHLSRSASIAFEAAFA